MALQVHNVRRSLLGALGAAAYDYGLRQGARELGNNLGSSLRHYYNRFNMPQSPRTPRRRGIKRKRTATSGRRRPFKRQRRYARRTLGKYRGRRYTQRSINRYRALNTNVTRNDYRTLRLCHHVGDIEIGRDTALVQNNYRYVCHLDHWTTQWSREIEAYDEFRFSNIQFVLTPRSVFPSTNQPQQNIVSVGDIPYMACRIVNPNAPIDSNQTAQEIRATPGFRFLDFTKKRRYIFNVSPGVKVATKVINESGSEVTIDRHMKAPWMMTNNITKALDLAAIEIRKPTFEGTGGQLFKWDIKVYATLHLRGNNDELIEPY